MKREKEKARNESVFKWNLNSSNIFLQLIKLDLCYQ